MCLIETSRRYDRDLLRGVSRYARFHGPWEIFRLPPFYLDPNGRETALKQIRDWGTDGLILRENRDLEDKIPAGIPTVVSAESNERVLGCGNIVGDHEAIGCMAAKHLLECGFRNFAYCGFDDVYWSERRRIGFCKTIEASGHTAAVYQQPLLPANLLWEKERPHLEQWLKTLPNPTGLMACADERSYQILQACKAVGGSVPHDIAIIGADNDELICDLCHPTLSSVAFNTVRVGYEAARLLENMILCDPPEDQREVVLKPTHVTVRQSTDIVATDDHLVAEALRYIRDNAHLPLTVDAVVEESAVSRRMLERRFKRALGISIYRQIVVMRTKRVEQLLTETNLTVTQIAERLRFSNHQQIDRYFRQCKGMTPKEFRHEVREV